MNNQIDTVYWKQLADFNIQIIFEFIMNTTKIVLKIHDSEFANYIYSFQNLQLTTNSVYFIQITN